MRWNTVALVIATVVAVITGAFLLSGSRRGQLRVSRSRRRRIREATGMYLTGAEFRTPLEIVPVEGIAISKYRKLYTPAEAFSLEEFARN